MIKPSSTEVQNMAKVATESILADLDILKENNFYGVIQESDIIQLKIEQVLTAMIAGFETEISKVIFLEGDPTHAPKCKCGRCEAERDSYDL